MLGASWDPALTLVPGEVLAWRQLLGGVPTPLTTRAAHPSSSCFNGGTCVDGINSFTCLCPPGFTGSYCQHDVNECDSRPCLHGGTCHDSYGAYKCTCPQGYTGLNCQVSEGRGRGRAMQGTPAPAGFASRVLPGGQTARSRGSGGLGCQAGAWAWAVLRSGSWRW